MAGVKFIQSKDIENLRTELKQEQDETHHLRSQVVKQKEYLISLMEENKQLKIEKENLMLDKEQLLYEISTLKEELELAKENECKITAEIVKNNQKICQLVHDKENLDKIIDDKVCLIQKMEVVVKELTKECDMLRNDNEKGIQQQSMIQFMTNKIQTLNEEIIQKDNKLGELEYHLKSLTHTYQVEGENFQKVSEQDDEKFDTKFMAFEESIDNLEAENFRLCNENLRLKNEIKLLCNINNDGALGNKTGEEEETKQGSLINKIALYGSKLKNLLHQNWRLIEMVNKLQHINKTLMINKKKLRTYKSDNKNKNVYLGQSYEYQHRGDGEMESYQCY